MLLLQAGEKSKEDNTVDAIGEDEVTGIKNEEISSLKEELRELANGGRLDAYGYYLLVTRYRFYGTMYFLNKATQATILV